MLKREGFACWSKIVRNLDCRMCARLPHIFYFLFLFSLVSCFQFSVFCFCFLVLIFLVSTFFFLYKRKDNFTKGKEIGKEQITRELF